MSWWHDQCKPNACSEGFIINFSKQALNYRCCWPTTSRLDITTKRVSHSVSCIQIKVFAIFTLPFTPFQGACLLPPSWWWIYEHTNKGLDLYQRLHHTLYPPPQRYFSCTCRCSGLASVTIPAALTTICDDTLRSVTVAYQNSVDLENCQSAWYVWKFLRGYLLCISYSMT